MDRIAVVTGREGEPEHKLTKQVIADILRTGLRYGSSLLLVRNDSEQSRFQDLNNDETIRTHAMETGIDAVVVVGHNSDTNEVSARVLLIPEGDAEIRIPCGVADSGIIEASVKLRRKVLEALHALPEQHLRELEKSPNASLSSLRRLVRAKQAIGNLSRLKDSVRNERCKKAIELCDQALSESPKLIDAHLIKASCNDELGDRVQRNTALKIAKQSVSSQSHDRLTSLEIEGDYSRFVEGDENDAVKKYEEILEVAPCDLTALWSMLDLILYSGENLPMAEDRKYAASYASRIVALYPESGVAQAIRATASAEIQEQNE